MKLALTLTLGALALAGLTGCNRDCDDDDVACSSQCSHCRKAMISCNDCVPAPAPMAVATPCSPAPKGAAKAVVEIEKTTKPVPINREAIRIQVEKEMRARLIAAVEDSKWKEIARKPMTEDPSSF